MAGNSLSIILVEPQLGQNIGAVARAMLNFGLTDLRLVNPREGWHNPDAVALSAGAEHVFESLQVFPTLLAAISDLNRVFATSRREHNMIKTVYSPRAGLRELHVSSQQGQKVGILFGGERCGLSSNHISLCESIITIPTNPEFPSLNLAMSVAHMAYEWSIQAYETPEEVFRTGMTTPATGKDMGYLFAHLEEELDRSGFLRHKKKRPTMVRNIRNIFQRAHLTEQEVRTLRGIIRSLRGDPQAKI